MKHLEDENKKLETKLKILKEHEEYGSKIDDIVKQLENEMEEQIENLIRDQEKLQAELVRKQQEVEDTRKRFVAFSAAIFYLLWLLLITLNLHKLAQGRKTFFFYMMSGFEIKYFCLCSSYEDELQKKAELENDFILNKKVL